MSGFQQQFKKKTFGFGNNEESRVLRRKNIGDDRRNNRAKGFNEGRDITASKDSTLPPTSERLVLLKKWKEERERKRKLEEKRKRPAFKVGVVHHKLYSPAVDESKTTQKPVVVQKPNPPAKKISKATEKRLAEKLVCRAVKKSRNTDKSKKTVLQEIQETKSFAPENHEFKAPANLFGRSKIVELSATTRNSSDSSNEAVTLKLSSEDESNENVQPDAKNDSLESLNGRRTSTPIGRTADAVSFSPYIVSSRGKSNARKEEKLKRGFSLSSVSPEDALNISQEEQNTAHYFRLMLNKEVERLNESCAKWSKVQESLKELDEENRLERYDDAIYQIAQAIGQTNILINKKCERFRGLVADCESGRAEMLVQVRDLQGFWDMMYREIENCYTRFDALEKLKSNDWIEPTEEPVAVQTKANRAKVRPKRVVTKRPSALRDLIMAKRLKKFGDVEPVDKSDEIKILVKEQPTSTISVLAKKKTPGTPSQRRSRSVNLESPLTLMKVTQKYKTPKITHDDSIKTPGKGILKHLNTSNEDARVKSAHKVNFDVDKTPQQEDSTQDTDQQTNQMIKRKLSFDDFLDEMGIRVASTDVTPNTDPPVVTEDEPPKKKRRRSRRTILDVTAEESESTETPVRALRSRLVSLTPMTKTAKMDVNEKESSTVETATESAKETKKRKRSTASKHSPQKKRKSLRIEDQKKKDSSDDEPHVSKYEAECIACTVAIPRTPLKRPLPDVRLSFLGERVPTESNTFNDGNLISFDSPYKTPGNVRRSKRFMNK